MTPEQLITWAISNGWTLDRWGHLRKGDRRLKVSRVAVRYEAKTGAGDWVRLRSAYLRDVTLRDGKLAGLTHAGPQPKPTPDQALSAF